MFPGQGSQYKGMGKGLFSKYQRETQLASQILGYDLEALCITDPERKLVKTQFTQPALYVVNYFLYKEKGDIPDYFMGHSLGEYNALLAAGAYDFETGLRLVQKRGALMAATSGGGMAAVLGLEIEKLKEKLEEGNYKALDIANYNTPSQTVLSGPLASINEVVKNFTDAGIRIIPLRVSAPFHSRYMKPAAEEFSNFLEEFRFNPLKVPVIANVTARPYEAGTIADLLGKQISGSVKWSDSVRYLMGQNVSDFKELGRAVLTKMTDEITSKCTPIRDTEVMRKSQEEAKGTKELSAPGKVSKNGSERSLKLGSEDFRKDYGIAYSYVAGAMYKRTASKEMVIRMGKAGMLAYLGTGGLSLSEMEEDICCIQSELLPGQAYGMNLLHNMSEPDFEMKTVELFLRKGIKNIEAAAYMQMTEPLVYFHVAGLSMNMHGKVINNHNILAKVSRPEVARAFMSPAPEKLLHRLMEKGKITQKQAMMARSVPMSYDICVEADSGGHTDGGAALVIFPSIQILGDRLQKQFGYLKRIRIGLAGGIGAPQSAASAFVMGADFVLTGSINQCTVEAGTSDAVKDLLERIDVQDTGYAPAGDMFEIGAKVQVLKKGVLFPARANKLYNLYHQYGSLEDIPIKTLEQLERNYFKRSVKEVWEETKSYLQKRGQQNEITRAEQNPKYKMSLVFRWYFGFTSDAAMKGDLENKVNFQVHTGPALGAFNQWVKGTALENWRNRHVDEIGKKLMKETEELFRHTLLKISR